MLNCCQFGIGLDVVNIAINLVQRFDFHQAPIELLQNIFEKRHRMYSSQSNILSSQITGSMRSGCKYVKIL